MNLLTSIAPAGLVEYYRNQRSKQTIHKRRVDFYQSFLEPGNLVFDIGANVGDRVSAMLDAGCRVIAVEPQEHCCAIVRRIKHKRGSLTVVPKACGAKAGTAVLKSGSTTDVLATISDDYIAHVKQSGRFGGHTWKNSYNVSVCTAENLVSAFGTPRYIKIDVEGFEVSVLDGLTSQPELLSFEFTPEMPDPMLTCVNHCVRLGMHQFNISYGESMRFARTDWVTAQDMRSIIKVLAGDSTIFGDIFARRTISS